MLDKTHSIEKKFLQAQHSDSTHIAKPGIGGFHGLEKKESKASNTLAMRSRLLGDENFVRVSLESSLEAQLRCHLMETTLPK